MPDDLLNAITAAARATDLSKQDVVRQSIKAGLPSVVAKFKAQPGRITNVEPLAREVLIQIYHSPDEDDEAGVKRFMAAQSIGGAD